MKNNSVCLPTLFIIVSSLHKSPKDWQLLVIIAVLVGVDVIILLVPTALPASRLMATLVENKEKAPSTNVGLILT